MDVLAAYREVGSYRGAAQLCGTTHKTVKRIVERHNAGGAAPPRKDRGHNYDPVAELVADRVQRSQGRISAKRLLPAARTAGYEGSPRNFRRLVAEAKQAWRRGHHRGRRPAVWTPGDTLAIDWGVQDGVHVFCAVLAWSRFRFVRFAADEKAATTMALLAECFEVLGGVPKTVLADRMGCLKAGVVANVVVPTADYVRFATHYGFRPDFCQAADPESKGIVEALVGYAKRDLMVPLRMAEPSVADLAAANAAAAEWCAEVNAVVHSEICAVPAERLQAERELLGPLPSLRLELGAKPISRKVDKLSCVRFGSARYSVPNRLIGTVVLIAVAEGRVQVLEPFTGEVVAEHALVAPGEVSIVDDHYGSTRPDKPRRAPRAKTTAEKRVPGPRRGRGGVPDRRGRGRGRQPRPGDRPDPHPARRPRRRRAACGVAAGGAVQAVARRRRPLHPGRRRRRTPAASSRAGPGADPAGGADPVAERLRDPGVRQP